MDPLAPSEPKSKDSAWEGCTFGFKNDDSAAEGYTSAVLVDSGSFWVDFWIDFWIDFKRSQAISSDFIGI